MSEAKLKFGGEFRDTAIEQAFTTARFDETLRQCRLLFALSAVLNTLFLLSDWRFAGTPHFFVAVPARLSVVAFSLLCVWLVARATTVARAEAVTVLWQATTAVAVAFLVSSRSDLALFVVLLLPSIFYLVAPTSFRFTLLMGIGTSVLMLMGYLGRGPYPTTLLGLVLVLAMLNFALSLVVIHANRLRRLEWLATQSERSAREALEESQALLERVFMAVPIPLVVTAVADGAYLRANAAAIRYLGGPDATDLAGLVIADSIGLDDRRRAMAELRERGQIEALEVALRDGCGRARDAVITAATVPIGQNQAFAAGFVDITERNAAAAQMRWQATHDALTGLPNRLSFHERLTEALSRRTDGSVALYLVDLDDFKSINDTLGHDVGDHLLIAVGERLQQALEPGDVVARLGGDEFVVIAELAGGLDQAAARAEGLMQALCKPFSGVEIAGPMRASIGYALSPHHHDDVGELLKDADLALYRAKALGRNMALVYDPAMREAMHARVEICAALCDAVAQGRVVPFYQPQIDLRSGAIDGLEVLARWDHPQRGIVPAGAFLLALQDPETARQIGDAVLRGAMADCRAWLDAGLVVPRLWINLAPGVFRDPAFPDILLDRLGQAGHVPAQFGVEVTENVLLTRQGEQAGPALQRLRAAGISVALDDFGTGYASLTHLRRLPVDVVKIDRAFVARVGEGGEDAAIVRAVVALTAELRLDVIAEGIETVEQQEFLRAQGCRLGQGYLYARPVPASEVPALIARADLWPATDAGQGGAATA
ncbi:bifunctional diguanylate cyclase/phosphodiesterase [Bosea sp. (in: a-proteobacteria)]|uniref:putative bifunctional diguanylate cyclase/phosphodiesterase n=1 Tax=Bosea sp. (in: a-proteobacteria) TaxID=1871050 RepID=UPI0027358CCB|nr:EAL domain-containing protein [Bosea sp. (in: a-proteobacteria)]MDP3407008.1 EAL domain-containing protein [Bosea sp. (in: a-proteobacteria)]